MKTHLITGAQSKALATIIGDHYNTVSIAQEEPYGNITVSVFGMQGTGEILIQPDGATVGD